MSSTVAGCVPAGVAPDGAAVRVGCDGDAGRDDREDRVEVAVQHDQRVGPDPAGPPPGRSASGRPAAAWPEPDRAAADRPELTGDAAVDEVLRRVRGPRAPSPAATGPDGAGPDGSAPDGAGPDGAAAALAVRHDELAAAHRDLRALLVAAPPDVPDGSQDPRTSPPTADLPPVQPGTAGPAATHLGLQVGGPDR